MGEREDLEARLPEHLRKKKRGATTVPILKWMVATGKEAHVKFYSREAWGLGKTASGSNTSGHKGPGHWGGPEASM